MFPSFAMPESQKPALKQSCQFMISVIGDLMQSADDQTTRELDDLGWSIVEAEHRQQCYDQSRADAELLYALLS